MRKKLWNTRGGRKTRSRNYGLKEVSIIIVCRNSKEIIRRSIESALLSNPLEVIVVDGNSTDGTREIVEEFKDEIKILTDPGKGVAMARQIGVDAAIGKYIFFMGCDNQIEPDSILRLKEYMIHHNWVYCGMLTRIKDTSSYLGFCNNERWKYKFYEGERRIVGTPFIVETRILREFPYNTDLMFADDRDLCERITGNGYKMGYSDVICYEILDNSIAELKRRYKMYGISDAEYHCTHKQEWSFVQRCKSLLHPIRVEFALGLRKAKGVLTKLKLIPYLTMITYFRYMGWCEHNK